MQEQKKMDKRTRILVVTLGVTLGIFLAGKAIGLVAEDIIGHTATLTTVTVFRSIAAVIAMVLLGGVAWLGFSWRSVRETWGFALPLIIINLVLGISIASSVLLGLMKETISIENFIMYGTLSTVLCLFVGINEEVMFRGLVLGGLLAKYGDTTQGILKAAIVSSLLFGAVHVVFSMNYSNLYSVGSGIMKTLETAMFAFILCVPVIRGKKLWGAILAHGFFDWILLCGNAIQNAGFPDLNYASDDPALATATMTLFAIICVLYLPFCIRAYFKLKELKAPQLGPFVKDESAQAEAPKTA